MDDLSLERRIAFEAAAMAWVLASSGSKGSEEKEDWQFLRIERVDFDFPKRSFALRDEVGSILGNVCRGIVVERN